MLTLALYLAPISGMTDTAYTVETVNGTAFVPYTKVHPRTPAVPLVVFA